MFKWRAWQCLVLDEAHNIKNSKSLRWNKLLSLRTRIRLLLTGTPLQNNLMELWSLLYFLMPSVFSSQDDFKNWFNDPMSAMAEGAAEYNSQIVEKLHTVLRPFILRRLKSEVEKQMPLKLERVIFCPLARIQRNMYNQFIRQKSTIDTLRGGS
uniref:Helicase ATP-binding domain-containing protein n=1 Tax=Panagrolaimus sp. ES5 TaxID=591445 RepID=A0AC34GJP8_9BILA